MNIDGTTYPIKLVNYKDEHLNAIKDALRDSGQNFSVQKDISNDSILIFPIGKYNNRIFDIDAIFDFSLEDIIRVEADQLSTKPFKTNIHCLKGELLSCLRLFIVQWGQGDWGGSDILDLKYIDGDCYYFHISGEEHDELVLNTDQVLNNIISMHRKASYFLFSFIAEHGKFKEMVEFENKLQEVLLNSGYDINEVETIMYNFQIGYVLNVKYEIPIFVK